MVLIMFIRYLSHVLNSIFLSCFVYEDIVLSMDEPAEPPW